MDVVAGLEREQMRDDRPDFRAGDTVRVHLLIREGEKERTQLFEGIVIRKTKRMNRSTFTVRKISYGIGVERVFALHSPLVSKIDVLARGKVRRARLFYLRARKGRAARVKERRIIN
ncbi:MAG: 50S ribosomal protein L19 [Thermodesulfobacteriota bacterium]